MAFDAPTHLITCAQCGQRMRIPPATTARYFRCVKCGALIDTGASEEVIPEPPAGETQETKPAEVKGPDSLTQLLIGAGLVSSGQITEAMEVRERRGGKLFDILIRQGHLKKEALHNLLSRQPGAAGISLAHFTLGRDMIAVLPREMVVRNFAVPIDKLGKLLTVAMVCPLDMDAISEIQEATGLRVKPMLCSHDDFQAMLQKYFRQSSESEEEQRGVRAPAGDSSAAVSGSEASEGAKAPESAPQSREIPGTEELRQRLHELQRLEIGARVAAQITALVGTGGESLRQMTAAAASSPPLAATLMATANSGAYGMPGLVDSLPMAMALLGEHGVNLVASNMRQCDSAMERHLAVLSRHCRKVGGVASLLAGATGACAPSVAQSAGWLHAVGSFALALCEPEEYRKIDRRLVGFSRETAERQVFGLGHAEAGALLLARWQIPAVIQESVRNYTNYGVGGEAGAALLAVAVASVGVEGEYDGNFEPDILAAMDRLGLSEEAVHDAVSKTA